MKADDLTLGRIPFGAVYLVDRGLSLKEKRRDLENMKKLHFNTVVLWPAVSRWDAEKPGNTAFKSIDQVMDLCSEIGLKAVLELQGQNTSNQEAPENFLLHDGRPALNDPAYRHLTCTYLREVAAHFKGHPALLAYDIYNEIGYNSNDKYTREEFGKYLEKKYNGDIQALNRLWGTFFTGFAQIADLPPSYNAQYRIWLSATGSVSVPITGSCYWMNGPRRSGLRIKR
jgi:beta-galactosidase GanA